jgi:hypothetical protein
VSAVVKWETPPVRRGHLLAARFTPGFRQPGGLQDAANVVAVVVGPLLEVSWSGPGAPGGNQRLGQLSPLVFVLPDARIRSADPRLRFPDRIVGHADEYAASCCNSAGASRTVMHMVATDGCNHVG